MTPSHLTLDFSPCLSSCILATHKGKMHLANAGVSDKPPAQGRAVPEATPRWPRSEGPLAHVLSPGAQFFLKAHIYWRC